MIAHFDINPRICIYIMPMSPCRGLGEGPADHRTLPLDPVIRHEPSVASSPVRYWAKGLPRKATMKIYVTQGSSSFSSHSFVSAAILCK